MLSCKQMQTRCGGVSIDEIRFQFESPCFCLLVWILHLKTMVNGFLPSYQRVSDPAIIDSNNVLPSYKRVSDPAIIDSNNVTKIYPPNANLTITGTEKYVNSGWMFPRRELPGS